MLDTLRSFLTGRTFTAKDRIASLKLAPDSAGARCRPLSSFIILQPNPQAFIVIIVITKENAAM